MSLKRPVEMRPLAKNETANSAAVSKLYAPAFHNETLNLAPRTKNQEPRTRNYSTHLFTTSHRCLDLNGLGR